MPRSGRFHWHTWLAKYLIVGLLAVPWLVWKSPWFHLLLVLYIAYLSYGLLTYLCASWRSAGYNGAIRARLRGMTPAERDVMERAIALSVSPGTGVEVEYMDARLHGLPGAPPPATVPQAAESGRRFLGEYEEWRAAIEGRAPRPVDEIIARWANAPQATPQTPGVE